MRWPMASWGFTPIRWSLHRDEAAVQRLASESRRLMGEGRSVLVYTSLDPETDRGGALDPFPVGATVWARRWAASHATASRRWG
jgi:hypothetical protein